MWTGRGFLGKTQSDKFLDSGQSRITFMEVEVMGGGKEEGNEGEGEETRGKGIEKLLIVG